MARNLLTQRKLDGMARQDQALHLRRQGNTWQAIADELGYRGGAPAAATAAKAAMNRVPAEDAAAIRELEAERLDQRLTGLHRLEAELWAIVETRQPSVSVQGKVIVEVEDLQPKLAALHQLREVHVELRRVGESRRKLVGADAPTRRQVEVNVVDPDSVEATIRRLEADLDAQDPEWRSKLTPPARRS